MWEDGRVTAIVVAAGIVLPLIAGLLISRRSRSRVIRSPTVERSDRVYLGLRDRALHAKREELGLAAPAQSTLPWAAMMDWGVSHGTATVLAVADGTASIYLSTGGGSIGGGQSHEAIRSAARSAVAVATELHSQLSPTSTYPLPKLGDVFFYAMTDAGVFTSGGKQEEFSNHLHPLSKLGDALQQVITQYRVLENRK
jgi:hypothetical protein